MLRTSSVVLPTAGRSRKISASRWRASRLPLLARQEGDDRQEIHHHVIGRRQEGRHRGALNQIKAQIDKPLRTTTVRSWHDVLDQARPRRRGDPPSGCATKSRSRAEGLLLNARDHATRSAVEEGIVPAAASPCCVPPTSKELLTRNDDQKTASEIVRRRVSRRPARSRQRGDTFSVSSARNPGKDQYAYCFDSRPANYGNLSPRASSPGPRAFASRSRNGVVCCGASDHPEAMVRRVPKNNTAAPGMPPGWAAAMGGLGGMTSTSPFKAPHIGKAGSNAGPFALSHGAMNLRPPLKRRLLTRDFPYVLGARIVRPEESWWLDQLVSRRRPSMQKDVRAGPVGAPLGRYTPGRGPSVDLLEPEEVVPECEAVGPPSPPAALGPFTAALLRRWTTPNSSHSRGLRITTVWLPPIGDREGHNRQGIPRAY